MPSASLRRRSPTGRRRGSARRSGSRCSSARPTTKSRGSCSTRRAISSMWGRRRSTSYEVTAIAVPARLRTPPLTPSTSSAASRRQKPANVPGNSGSTARIPTMTTARSRANMPGLRTGRRCTKSIWSICRRSVARSRTRSPAPSRRWRKPRAGCGSRPVRTSGRDDGLSRWSMTRRCCSTTIMAASECSCRK